MNLTTEQIADATGLTAAEIVRRVRPFCISFTVYA